MPIIIFHGDLDEVIYYRSSVKLKEIMKTTDTLITLQGQGHNGITDNQEYKIAIQKLLSF
jgi:predicted esterase